jgi:steroid delta-isomerase-like uncharacterized protein
MKRTLMIPLAILLGAACQAPEPADEDSATAETEAANEALVHRWIEAWGMEEAAAFAEYDAIAAPDVHLDSQNLQVHGMAEWRNHFTEVKEAFPDIAFTVEEIFAAGDRVAVRWRGTGTHEGEFMGIPGTGLPIDVTGTGIVHVVDGMIQTWTENYDGLALMQQIGAIPMPGE